MTTPPLTEKKIDRRSLLGQLGRLAGSAAAANFIGFRGIDGTLLPGAPVALAAGAPAQRFFMIYLSGAWNSNFSTDPVVGEKLTSGGYDPAFNTLETGAVPGKGNLLVGPGLLPAVSGFAAVPTAFVNGLKFDVLAHDIGMDVALAGMSGTLRGGVHAGLVALLGAKRGGFPAHVALGGRIPLLGTQVSGPGLFARDIKQLGLLLSAPSDAYDPASFETARDLLSGLDNLHQQSLAGKAANFGDRWRTLREQVMKDAAQMGAGIELTGEIKSRYKIAESGSVSGLIAGAYLCLAANLTHSVAVTIGGFDTHSDDLGRQLPRQVLVAKALNQMLLDLSTTPDPASAGQTLADTTTVFVVSEFTRTPRFNASGGTDHWGTCSSIVCGRGVRDNTVIGATSKRGGVFGWVGGQPVALSASTRIEPEDLAATVLRHMGEVEAANVISTRSIDGLFV